MPKNKARLRFACEVARIDPDRFNEAVAAGSYPCAPPTSERKPRIFTIHDMIVLCIYGELLGDGMPPAAAGPWACAMGEVLANHPETAAVTSAKFSNGARWNLPVENVNLDATSSGIGDLLSYKVWKIAPYRKRVEDALAEADEIAGDE